jgi:hypothetical protein
MKSATTGLVAGALIAMALAFSATAVAQAARQKNALHGAIAFHQGSGSVGWATDRRTSREAQVEALKQCNHEKCVVVANVSRACAAVARDRSKFVVQKGATQQEAETKAMAKCGALCQIAAWTCTH